MALLMALPLAALAVFSTYVIRWERELTSTWEARRAPLPSRLFSAPTRLYEGRRMDPVELGELLKRLGYREAPDGAALRPGNYRWGPNRLEVHLHDFAYPGEPLDGFPVELRWRRGRIVSLRNLETSAPLALVRLEPLEYATLFGSGLENRSPVALEAVPEVLVQAVLAAEDRRFYRHRGLDVRRIVGAALHNLRRGEIRQGGSTLTQQLIKNYYLTPERTLRRKVKEAVMAVLFETRHSKREILEAYLNEVYLGQQGAASIVGVGEAARHYFSKEVGQIELPEAALLAGLIRGPALYDPFRHPERARARRAAVLRAMRETGFLSAAREREAAAAPLPTPPPRRRLRGAPWFTDHVVRELGRRFSRERLRRQGFRIFTTLDPAAQRAADGAVAGGLEELERAHPELAAGEAGEEGPEAAMVVLDPRTGDLLALVGGRDYAARPFHRAVQAMRQPGSLFKPFVYLAALSDESGRWTLASRIADTALAVEVGGKTWTPSNADERFHGLVSLREALERSYNVATVRLALEVGLERVVRTARTAGIRSPLEPVPAVALGAFEVTPLEMAEAYGVLATGGMRAEPLSVLSVVSPTGEAMEAHRLAIRRVAPEGPVYLVNRALQGAMRTGTAAAAAALGYRGSAAGKTGTTSGYRDAWFVGYTPALVVLVWVGFDDGRPLGLSGAEAALPIWTRFMREYPAAGSGGDFVPPPELVEVLVDSASGLLAHRRCGPARLEAFRKGTEPTVSCRGRR